MSQRMKDQKVRELTPQLSSLSPLTSFEVFYFSPFPEKALGTEEEK